MGLRLTTVTNALELRREYNIWRHTQNPRIIAGETCRILLQTPPPHAVKPRWRRGLAAVKDPGQVVMPGARSALAGPCDIPRTTVTIWCRYSSSASDL